VLFDTALAIDGGAHTIRASAPHKRPFEVTIQVAPERPKITVNVEGVQNFRDLGSVMRLKHGATFGRYSVVEHEFLTERSLDGEEYRDCPARGPERFRTGAGVGRV
jgi:hypothetical protein